MSTKLGEKTVRIREEWDALPVVCDGEDLLNRSVEHLEWKSEDAVDGE